MSVAEPMPTMAPKAVEMFIKGKVTASPDNAKASTPCPMNMLSTMLYSDAASIAIIEGRAYFLSSSPTGRVPNSLGIFLSVILSYIKIKAKVRKASEIISSLLDYFSQRAQVSSEISRDNKKRVKYHQACLNIFLLPLLNESFSY